MLVTETGIRSGFVESTYPEVCKVEANHGLWPASVNMEQKKKKKAQWCVCVRVFTCVYVCVLAFSVGIDRISKRREKLTSRQVKYLPYIFKEVGRNPLSPTLVPLDRPIRRQIKRLNYSVIPEHPALPDTLQAPAPVTRPSQGRSLHSLALPE